MEEKILSELKKMIKDKFNVSVDIDTLFSQTGIDSLDLLDLIVETEKKYKIRIDDNELINLKSVKDVIDVICKDLKNKK